MASKQKIVEQYQDYAPPVRVNEAVRLLLRHVPAEHLEGLHTIVLTNSASLLTSLKGKFTAGGERFRAADRRGFYWNGRIFLVMDQIFRDYPEALLLVPMIKTLAIGEVLYHEVGHHIHRLVQPGYRDNKEAFADEWKDELLLAFVNKRYWYMAIIIRGYSRFINPTIKKLVR